MKKVLILGGCGYVGSFVTDILLTHFSVDIILADRYNTEEFADRLNKEFKGNRVRGTTVDATDMGALKSEFEKSDIVVVCVPMSAGAGESIVQAALESGVDYIDLDFEESKKVLIEALEEKIKRSKRYFVMGAGAGPGIPAALVHWGASFFDQVSDATVGAIMSGENLTFGTMKDFISIDQTDLLVYNRGEWRKAAFSDGRRIDFGDPFGKEKCYPEYIPEMDGCVKKYTPQNLDFLVTCTNTFVNILIVLWSLLKFNKSKMMLEIGTRLGLWGSKHFSRPPFGLCLKLEISGTRKGKTEELAINLFNENGWKATAIAVGACVKQLLDGTLHSRGPDYMGHLIDPQKFFKDMEQMGMKTSLSSSWSINPEEVKSGLAN